MSIYIKSCLIITLSVLLHGCVSKGARSAEPDELTSTDNVAKSDKTSLFDLQRDADAAYDEGRLLDAEQLYRRMLNASPSSGYAWMRLGNVQLRNDQLEAAIHAYRQCLRFETGESRCWQNLSLTYVEMAVATLEQADGKARDEESRQRMAAFKRRLVESVNVESNSAR